MLDAENIGFTYSQRVGPKLEADGIHPESPQLCVAEVCRYQLRGCVKRSCVTDFPLRSAFVPKQIRGAEGL